MEDAGIKVRGADVTTGLAGLQFAVSRGRGGLFPLLLLGKEVLKSLKLGFLLSCKRETCTPKQHEKVRTAP